MSPRRLRNPNPRQSPRPRVVYVAFYFPPTRASGVYRSRATANHLAAAGWDVTVITPQREFFTDYISSFDPSLEATVRGDVQVDRVRFPGRAWEPDVRRYSWLRANLPSVSKTLNNKLENALFPEHYSPWIPRVVRRIRQLHARAPVDLVLATGNPFSSFAAAWAVNRLTGVPYVVDYRDSWTLDLFKDEPAYPPGPPAWRRARGCPRAAIRHGGGSDGSCAGPPGSRSSTSRCGSGTPSATRGRRTACSSSRTA